MAAAGLLSQMAWASSISCRQFSAAASRGAARRLHSGASWAPLSLNTPASRPVAVRFSFSVSGPGAVDSPLMNSMQAKIEEALQAERVSVVDVNGDGSHVNIEVVSPLFEGKRSLDRQRMVYKAIWEELQSAVHAVDSMVTKAPSEL